MIGGGKQVGMGGWGDEGMRNGEPSYGRGRVGSRYLATARICSATTALWLKGAAWAAPGMVTKLASGAPTLLPVSFASCFPHAGGATGSRAPHMIVTGTPI